MPDHPTIMSQHRLPPMDYQSRAERIRTALAIALLAVASVVNSGCALPDWSRGPGLEGPNAELGAGLRPKGKSEMQGTGLDQRARDIEKNLGMRN
jgi:hypothetical protein